MSDLSAAAVPFWGASPVGTPPAALKPGEFAWDAAIAPNGPIVVVVSLTEQRGFVYRNGIEIGYTTVSTGKPGHETPTGIFTILQKDKDHHSSSWEHEKSPEGPVSILMSAADQRAIVLRNGESGEACQPEQPPISKPTRGPNAAWLSWPGSHGVLCLGWRKRVVRPTSDSSGASEPAGDV